MYCPKSEHHPIAERMLNKLVERDHIDTTFHKFSIFKRTIDGVIKTDKIELITVQETTEEGYVFELVVSITNEHEVNFDMNYSFSVRENLEPGTLSLTATREYHATGISILMFEELGIPVTGEMRSESREKDKYYHLVLVIRRLVGTLI